MRKPCIYKLTHIPSGHFYIGQTIDLKKRFRAHLSCLIRNHHHTPIQEHFNGNTDEWKIRALRYCEEEELKTLERFYLEKHVGVNPFCLNTNRGTRVPFPAGTTQKNVKGLEKRALAMIGKNCQRRFPRPAKVSFLSPNGRIYRDVINFSAFAREHHLKLLSLNLVARREMYQTQGWTVAA
mgnify:CR=1 FL=1